MKKLATTFFIAAMAAGGASAQTPPKPDYTKMPALGVHFAFQDFPTAAYIRSNSLNAALNDKQFGKVSEMAPALAISYWEGVNNNLDVALNLAGSFLRFPFKNGGTTQSSDKFLLELDATANFKMLPDNFVVSPYLTLGAGVSTYSGYWGAYVPVGTGIQVNVFDETFLQLQAQYRLGISDNTNYHFYWGLGFQGSLKKREEPKPAPVPPLPAAPVPPADGDGDGVPDADDLCPDAAGPKELKGCPDKDGDGIPDKDDKCPDLKGPALFEGCPPPDRDKDGIPDTDDLCPDTPGIARFKGCPVPDTDKDGVNDEMDKCPLDPGPASNDGCPEISEAAIEKVEMAAKEIFFASGNARFTSGSYAAMNEVFAVLKEDPSLKLEIDGHTDNTGSDAINRKLSQSRADAVKKYLVSKGISADRLTSIGFGPDRPVVSNDTAANRAKNRRVEMKLSK